MRQNATDLTARQLKAIQALLSCATVEQAAAKIKIGRQTIHRWLKNQDFQCELRKAKFKFLDDAILQLQRSSKVAADVLCDVMTDAEIPASTRVNASRIILDASMKGVELLHLEARLTELEKLNEKEEVNLCQ